MTGTTRGVASGALLGALLAFGVGCNGHKGQAPTESAGDERSVAEVCDVHCGIVMDPCNPNQILFDDLDHCLEVCNANDDDFWTGECGDASRELVYCVADLSCEERLDSYHGQNEGPCTWEQFEAAACRQGVDNPLGQKEDGQ